MTLAQNRDAREAGSATDAPRLTTAESLVLEVIVAHQLLGISHTTLSHTLWVAPQLTALADQGLISWTYDDQGDFRICPAAGLMAHPAAQAAADRASRRT